MSVKMSELMSDNAGLMEDAKKEVKKMIASSKVHEDVSTSVNQKSSALQNIQQRILETPIVDMQKVEAIKNKIANKELDINAMSIADKMLNLEAELFKKNDPQLSGK